MSTIRRPWLAIPLLVFDLGLTAALLACGEDDQAKQQADRESYIVDCRGAGFSTGQCLFFASRMKIFPKASPDDWWLPACEKTKACKD